MSVGLAAKELDCSTSKISRIETGVTAPRRPEIESLVRLYGDDALAQRDALVQLAAEGKQSAWYDEYGDLLEPGSTLHRYIGLEEGASQVRQYSCQWLPGLLQTEEFARAVFAVALPDRSPRDVDRLIAYRMDRRKVLTRAVEPLRMSVLIDEAVIRRPAGGPGVMKRQLDVLCETVQQPESTVEIRLLPFGLGLHGLLGGEFTVMSFGREEEDVIFFEGQEGAVFQEKSEIVRLHSNRWEAAWKTSLDGAELVQYLKEVAATFD